MTTIRESVSRVRGIFKAVKEDAFLTDRFIYSLLLKYGKAIIRRQDNEKKLMKYDSLFDTLPYVEMIEVDSIEADCAGIKTGCKIMRTKKKLPKVFHGSIGPLFRNVYSIDGSQDATFTTPMTYLALQRSTNFKYNKSKYYWFKNGHIYMPDSEWEAVQIEGIWEDSLDGYCTLNDDDCTLMQDKAFPIPDYLFAEIEQMVEQEMMTLGKLPSDGSDDSQNIIR